MNRESISKSLHEWLTSFVEVPNPKLGNWPPCPYARQARLNSKFTIAFVENNNFLESINHAKNILDTQDVVVICFDHIAMSAEYVQQYVTDINKILMQEDFVVLEDHPDVSEVINGVCMNFKICGLLLMQRLSKLQEASQQLKSKGYYNSWTKEDLDNVVTWRQNLHSVELI